MIYFLKQSMSAHQICCQFCTTQFNVPTAAYAGFFGGGHRSAKSRIQATYCSIWGPILTTMMPGACSFSGMRSLKP